MSEAFETLKNNLIPMFAEHGYTISEILPNYGDGRIELKKNNIEYSITLGDCQKDTISVSVSLGRITQGEKTIWLGSEYLNSEERENIKTIHTKAKGTNLIKKLQKLSEKAEPLHAKATEAHRKEVVRKEQHDATLESVAAHAKAQGVDASVSLKHLYDPSSGKEIRIKSDNHYYGNATLWSGGFDLKLNGLTKTQLEAILEALGKAV